MSEDITSTNPSLQGGHNEPTSLNPATKRHRSADGSLVSSPNDSVNSSAVEQGKLLSAVANISITSPIDSRAGHRLDAVGDSITDHHSDRAITAIESRTCSLKLQLRRRLPE